MKLNIEIILVSSEGKAVNKGSVKRNPSRPLSQTFVEASLLKKPQRLEPSSIEPPLLNRGQPLIVKCEGPNVSVELKGPSTRSSLEKSEWNEKVQNLAAIWKFLIFESWLRRKCVDLSLYPQNLGVVGGQDVIRKAPSPDSSLEDSEVVKTLNGEFSPVIKLEDPFMVYDRENQKFLSSFVGQKIKVIVVIENQSRPAQLSLSGRLIFWLDNYRTEQNLDPLFSARSIHIWNIGSTFHLDYCSSRDLTEDHVSFPENHQQQPTNISPTSCIHDPPTLLGWSDFKSHQCSLTLVPSRLRPEEHVFSMENMSKNSHMMLSCSWLQEHLKTINWTYCIVVSKSIWPNLSEPCSGLRSVTLFSSVKERSFPQSFSKVEETFGDTPKTLPLLVDILSTGFKTRFLSNSTKFESNFQSESSALLHPLDKKHVDFYEILQVFRDLRKCYILIVVLGFNACISLVAYFNRRVVGLISILCISKV